MNSIVLPPANVLPSANSETFTETTWLPTSPATPGNSAGDANVMTAITSGDDEAPPYAPELGGGKVMPKSDAVALEKANTSFDDGSTLLTTMVKSGCDSVRDVPADMLLPRRRARFSNDRASVRCPKSATDVSFPLEGLDVCNCCISRMMLLACTNAGINRRSSNTSIESSTSLLLCTASSNSQRSSAIATVPFAKVQKFEVVDDVVVVVLVVEEDRDELVVVDVDVTVDTVVDDTVVDDTVVEDMVDVVTVFVVVVVSLNVDDVRVDVEVIELVLLVDVEVEVLEVLDAVVDVLNVVVVLVALDVLKTVVDVRVEVDVAVVVVCVAVVVTELLVADVVVVDIDEEVDEVAVEVTTVVLGASSHVSP